MNIGTWWQGISWGLSSKQIDNTGTTQWSGVAGPDGEQSVQVRDKSLMDNWQALGVELPSEDHKFHVQDTVGVLPPGDDAESGNFLGPGWRGWDRWGNDEEEKERRELRRRLKNELKGNYDAVPQFVLDHGKYLEISHVNMRLIFQKHHWYIYTLRKITGQETY